MTCRRTAADAGSGSARAAVCFVVCLLAAAAARAADRPPIVAAQDDAFVAHQNGSDLWWIGSANLELVIGFDSSRTLALQRMSNPVTGRSWNDVQSLGVGPLGASRGDMLMQDGIELIHSGGSRAQILILTAR